MTVILDTRDIPPDDRVQAAREGIAELKIPVALHFADHTAAKLHGAFTDVGTLRICSLHSNVVRVNRSEQLTWDDTEPCVFLALQKRGSSMVVQDGRETVLRPGDLAVFDSTAPFTLLDDVGIRQWQIRIPVDRLGLPMQLLRDISATALSPHHPVADVAAAYFQRMASRPETFAELGAETVSGPSVELVRALLTTHIDATAVLRESMRATLPLRIMEFARSHLGDPNLDAAMIASEHHISVRHLYNVLAASGISLGSWIRSERLQRCRADLVRADAAGRTIAAIAREWGFEDPSSFARQFRSAYGLTPKEWRAINRHHPD